MANAGDDMRPGRRGDMEDDRALTQAVERAVREERARKRQRRWVTLGLLLFPLLVAGAFIWWSESRGDALEEQRARLDDTSERLTQAERGVEEAAMVVRSGSGTIEKLEKTQALQSESLGQIVEQQTEIAKAIEPIRAARVEPEDLRAIAGLGTTVRGIEGALEKLDQASAATSRTTQQFVEALGSHESRLEAYEQRREEQRRELSAVQAKLDARAEALPVRRLAQIERRMEELEKRPGGVGLPREMVLRLRALDERLGLLERGGSDQPRPPHDDKLRERVNELEQMAKALDGRVHDLRKELGPRDDASFGQALKRFEGRLADLQRRVEGLERLGEALATLETRIKQLEAGGGNATPVVRPTSASVAGVERAVIILQVRKAGGLPVGALAGVQREGKYLGLVRILSVERNLVRALALNPELTAKRLEKGQKVTLR